MNRNRMAIGLVTAMVVAVLFSTYIYHTVRRLSNVKLPEMKHIVVADGEMPLGTRLDAHNLRVINYPSDEPIAGTFARIEDCAGRALITAVAENEPILESRLAPREAGAGLPATIPEGMRALSVAVNDVVGVAGFVIPGTMVDVLVTGSLPGQSSNGDITRTILENIRVLAAGQKVEQDRDGKPQTVPVITLLVTPEDAAKLAMASTRGRIQLALRNTVDTKAANPPPVLQAVLFAGPAAAPAHPTVHRAVPVPPSVYVVEVITGSKKETKSFDQ